MAYNTSSHKLATCIECWKVPGAFWASWRSNGVLVLFSSIKVSDVVRWNSFSNRNINGNESMVNKEFKANIPIDDQLTATDERYVNARYTARYDTNNNIDVMK